MKKLFILHAILIIIAFTLSSCNSKKRTLDVSFLKDGVIQKESIPLDFIDANGKINSPYIDSMRFCLLDSITYQEMNADSMTPHTSPLELNFLENIEKYSPEYYTAYAAHNIIKSIEYYNNLFDNKIDFDFESEYRTIDVTFGDFPGITHPNFYILEKNSNPSPSLFFHEIGHRAFWFLEEESGPGIKFGGLSVIHMGLLEYFTVSLNDSPLIGEDCLPSKLIRNAEILCKYPLHDSLKLRRTIALVEESYPLEMQNPESDVAKNIQATYATYSDDVLDNIYENHRGGMVLTSTLWRIRQQIGQAKTDNLVAQTILDLNNIMNDRANFYKNNTSAKLPNRIEWYDVFKGLILKDIELNDGKNQTVIIKEFEKTGYPIQNVTI